MLLFSFAIVYCMFRFDGPSSGGINLNLFVVRGVGGGVVVGGSGAFILANY